MNTAKGETEIEEGRLQKQEEAQKELIPSKRDGEATGPTLDGQAGENRERKGKPCINMMKRRTRFLKKVCDDEREEKDHGRRRG